MTPPNWRGGACKTSNRGGGGGRAYCGLRANGAGDAPTGAPAATGPAEAGTRAYTSTWCTTSRAPGRISSACTHLSSAKLVGTSKYWYSIVPEGGTTNSSGIV